MRSTRKVSRAVLLMMLLLAGTGALASVPDDYVPEIKDRVARISFIRGEVQIRRAGTDEWEKADLNLPVVEGDELTVSRDSRFEIQFDSYKHLRVAENSYIQILKLRDEGIAVSVPQGTASIRINSFNSDREFFEIDAPSTTVAIQRQGMYRIDAGRSGDQEIRVTAMDDGEARVYSVNSGFTLRSGRSAKIFIGGSYAGEWETTDASRYADEFDTWALERDAVIAQRIRDAHYDKYYDRDIYGAEDLNEYGEWVYTRKYGYVWRPYRSATSGYANWSPYRYGHWRWVPPYGWTWVNDEPWGWATYHHGRWIWDDGYWVWTPYGYYRSRRSWWHPALVVVSIINRSVCWYPMTYHDRYYGYHRRRHSRNNNYSGGGSGGPAPSPTPNTPTAPVITPVRGGRYLGGPPLGTVPPGGVVSVPEDQFGRGRGGGYRTPPLAVANDVFTKSQAGNETPPILPDYIDVKGKVSKEIVAETPPIIVRDSQTVRTGATDRKTDAPLDTELRKSRVFGNRPPMQTMPETKTAPGGEPAPRKTGAVERTPPVKRDDTPVFVPPKDDTPVYVPPPRKEESPRVEPPKQKRDDTPTYVPPPRKRDEPKWSPPPKQDDGPVYTPPPRNDPPPRYDPPPKSDPPPQKSDPPPSKSDGPVDRKKDG